VADAEDLASIRSTAEMTTHDRIVGLKPGDAASRTGSRRWTHGCVNPNRVSPLEDHASTRIH
jgi:hypothetical protein